MLESQVTSPRVTITSETLSTYEDPTAKGLGQGHTRGKWTNQNHHPDVQLLVQGTYQNLEGTFQSHEGYGGYF